MKKVVKTYHQTLHGSKNDVFPLLCPVKETEWLHGWSCEIIHSESGYAEKGCIFETKNHYGSYHWIITRHDKEEFIIQFIKSSKDLVVIIDISLKDNDEETILCDIQYTFIPLSEDFFDQHHLEKLDKSFNIHMKKWEHSLNYYLKHGEMLIG